VGYSRLGMALRFLSWQSARRVYCGTAMTLQQERADLVMHGEFS